MTKLDDMQPKVGPLVTVVICTRNRAASLDRTLASLAASRLDDPVDWEVLVVDNGSTDETEGVITRRAAELTLRSVTESRPGLSFARNRGLEAAKGAYIIWTDDDVTVEADWLQTYLDAFHADPDAVVFGGTVRPVFEGQPPAWLTRNRAQLRYLLAECAPAQPTTFQSGDTELPYGANFAVRTSAQQAHLYDTELGASPMFNRLGEEEHVIRALLSDGAHGRWVPGAIVNHHIPQARQTLAYVTKYARAGGETWAYLRRRAGEGAVPRWVIRNLVRDYVSYRLYRTLGAPEKWLPKLCSFAYCQGAYNYFTGPGRAQGR